jgi:hypothetical protein
MFAATAFVLVGCFTAVPASAHFKLLKPASWLNEDSTGGPQKGSPCGPGNSGLLGDDVQPVPTSGMVTEFHAGDMIEVELNETIPHPGYFRIALAKNRSEFTIPPVDNAMSCALDLDKVPTGAHDNILADGLWKEPNQPSARHLTTMVKLPNEPCDKCTIQVVQVMKDHGLNSCYYYHCADIKILPAGGATGAAGASAAGSGGSAPTAGASGAAGMATAGSSATAGTGGAAGSGAGSPASATAGTGSAGMSGTAGRTSSAAGSVAAPSGGTGTAAGGTGAAGQGTTTSANSAAGATGVAGGAPMTAAPAESSGCTITSVRSSGGSLGARAGLALLAVAFVLRSRRRRTARVRGLDA